MNKMFTDVADGDTEVVIYSKNNCPNCVSTKNAFNRLNIAFKEINIDENPEARELLISSGFRAAPVVLTKDASWSGFNMDEIKRLAESLGLKE